MGGRCVLEGGAQTLLRRFGALQRVKRLIRHLEKPDRRRWGTWTGVLKPDYQPHRLSRRLSDDTIVAILAMYHAGATMHEVGERFDLAHSSINKLLQPAKVSQRGGAVPAHRGAASRQALRGRPASAHHDCPPRTGWPGDGSRPGPDRRGSPGATRGFV